MSSSTAAVRWYHPKASINDLRSVLFWKDVAAELLTVTVLMTTIVLVLITTNEEHYKINTTHLGLYATVVVYLLLEGYGPINGGVHLNPAASFSLFLAGKISLAKGQFGETAKAKQPNRDSNKISILSNVLTRIQQLKFCPVYGTLCALRMGEYRFSEV